VARDVGTREIEGPAARAQRLVEEGTASVVRLLRRAIDAGDFSVDDAIDLALSSLARPGGPGARLSTAARAQLRHVVNKLALGLDPSQPRTVLAFARSSSQAAWSLVLPDRHPGQAIAEVAGGVSVKELARAALYAEGSAFGDPEEHVRRAVLRAVRERRRSHGRRSLPLGDADPLRAVLDVPQRGTVKLPKNDVRMRIAEAADGTALGHALRQAARFSEELLRPALGEDIWSLGRPVGFADKRETRVLVEVKSAMFAHEMQLRGQELVHRLSRVTGFDKVTGVKIVVVEPAVLPVLKMRR
jgi:hypothetical protein